MVTQTYQPEVVQDMASIFKVLHINGGIVIRPRQAEETPSTPSPLPVVRSRCCPWWLRETPTSLSVTSSTYQSGP